MRVTQGMIYENARRNTGRAREAAEAAQQQASTGSRIRHPADDPAGSALLVSFNLNGERFDAIAKAVGAASDEIQQVDSALGDVNDALTRARLLAVQFANSGYSASQAGGAAEEVKGIIGRMVASMNTRFGNRYVFGGTKDDAPPFDSAGSYLGDAGVREVEVAPGVRQQTNVDARAFMKGTGLPGGVDVFAALSQLQAALASYDPAQVQGTLSSLDQGINQVSAATAQTGAVMNALDTGAKAAKVSSAQSKESASKVGEVDIIEASINLQATQTALQATLQATAKSFRAEPARLPEVSPGRRGSSGAGRGALLHSR